MKLKPNYKYICIFLNFLLLILLYSSLQAALTSVSLTLPNNLDTLSDGKKYYAAHDTGVKTYQFDVSASNSTAGSLADYDYFRLRIPAATGDIVINYDTDVSGEGNYIEFDDGTPAATNMVSATFNNSGTSTNPVIEFVVTFNWTAEQTINSSKTVTATVKESGVATTINDTKNQTYGICADVKVVSFAQDGVAADSFISPNHALFNVSGTVAYDIPGYNLENASDALNNADITSTTLELVRTTAGTVFYTDPTPVATAAFTEAIPASTVSTPLANGYYWRVGIDFAGTAIGTDENSTNGLSLECNEVRVTQIRFLGGLGRGPTHAAPDNTADYYREYDLPGTNIEITAQMTVDAGSGTAMHGNTTLTVEYDDVAGDGPGSFTVNIPSGSTVGTAAIEYNNATGFLNTWINTEQTEPWTYQVTGITGGSHELNQTGDGNGTAVTEDIIFDRLDPPSSGTPAITINQTRPTTTSITLYWTPLTINSSSLDGDFYEYRVYFRKFGSGDPWLQWDGDDDPVLRGGGLAPNNNWPVTLSDPIRHFDSNGWKYTTIPGLTIFTEYEYYVTAIDIFGNEITVANAGPDVANRSFRTQPFSIEVTITDGISTFENTSFADLNPVVRTFRDSAIKVTLKIVTSDEEPDSVKVWYTNYSTDAVLDIVGGNAINTAFPAGELFSAEAVRSGPNLYTAYLPSTVPIIRLNNSIRFIIETSLQGSSAFADSTIEEPADPNNGEWTFHIGTATRFTPWPTRILNNVITSKNRVAYPAYYLTDDAYVSIAVYDVKGRVVSTLLESAFRKGGQNIKDRGWRGTNKSGKKLGLGLYYIHFKAKRVSDGKLILNKFKKVVIAR